MTQHIILPQNTINKCSRDLHTDDNNTKWDPICSQICYIISVKLRFFCNRLIFSRTEPNLCLEDKLPPVYKMASSGLWKMFPYIIL